MHTYKIFLYAATKIVPVAQWIRRETTNLKIAGSNPVGDKIFFFMRYVCMNNLEGSMV